MAETTVDAKSLRNFRDRCMAIRGGSTATGAPGVQAIPDQVHRSLLSIDSFGGEHAPWAKDLMDTWNTALTWRCEEASETARELLTYAQALENAAAAYEDTDAVSSEDLDQYRHF